MVHVSPLAKMYPETHEKRTLVNSVRFSVEKIK